MAPDPSNVQPPDNDPWKNFHTVGEEREKRGEEPEGGLGTFLLVILVFAIGGAIVGFCHAIDLVHTKYGTIYLLGAGFGAAWATCFAVGAWFQSKRK